MIVHMRISNGDTPNTLSRGTEVNAYHHKSTLRVIGNPVSKGSSVSGFCAGDRSGVKYKRAPELTSTLLGGIGCAAPQMPKNNKARWPGFLGSMKAAPIIYGLYCLLPGAKIGNEVNAIS